MQKKSEELQVAIQEYFDVDWFSVKCYMRRQIAKCVNECKTQATNAKRIVGTLKHRSKRKSSDAATENGNWESDDDFDYWDSDFDEDFDDEPDEAVQPVDSSVEQQLNDKCETLAISPAVNEEVANACAHQSVNEPAVNHVDEQPVTLPPKCTSAQASIQRCAIPRGPIKRPPSGPPPPPVPQPPSQEPAEEYEIPISHPVEVQNHLVQMAAGPVRIPPKTNTFRAALNPSSTGPIVTEPTETYEIIEPVEENYEVVQSPPVPVKPPEKPNLPPRLPCAGVSSPPPPLPLKPKKFQENSSNLHLVDGCRSLSRPKLPSKQEDDVGHENSHSSLSGSLGSTILNSFLGRRNSNSSSSLPRMNHHLKERNSSDSILSVSGATTPVDDHSHSISPEKDGFITVGSSAFINTATSLSAESVKTQPSKHDEIAQNMATRPLPPVPQMQSKCSNIQSSVTSFPWFNEIEREDAEQQIRTLGTSGAFLVRPSKRAGKENPYTLTVFHNDKIFHLNIRQRPDDTFALGKEKKREKTFAAVADLIAYHQKEPILLTSRGESAGQTVLGVYPEY